MRDAIGGSTTLVIIVVFIVIALGYLAFNINYTKAFRMKDKIVTLYDDYDGNCLNSSKCQQDIKTYAKQIGYSTDTGRSNFMKCPSGYTAANGIYCYKKENVSKINDDKERYYYKIVTKINLEIPIIKNVMDLRFFYIYGDTKTYKN